MHDFIQQSVSLCLISLSVPRCFDQDYSHVNKISWYEKISKEISEIYLSRSSYNVREHNSRSHIKQSHRVEGEFCLELLGFDWSTKTTHIM